MSWQAEYQGKCMPARDAVGSVESGMRVYIHSGCAEPETLVEALVGRAPQLRDVEIVHILTFGTAPYVAPEMAGHFRHVAFFMAANVRAAVNEGRADFVPIQLSEVEGLFASGQMPLDVALVQLSPPDGHGFVSLGVGVDLTMTAVRHANRVIAQVNDQMPRTHGDTFLHVRDIDAFVETSRPLCEVHGGESTAETRASARNVAALIEDGATLQVGIGAIPEGVLEFLHDRKDLGVHSEIVSDAIIPLMESGVINGRRKTLLPRKMVVGFLVGTRKLFQFAHDNPGFEFRANSFVNNSQIIAQNDNMVAINSALQIDLTGQVCADSIGTFFYSGIGGRVDFLRGASLAKGGKAILALTSTAKNGAVSRITPRLEPGAGVVTTRGLVRYVVTEFGAAYLHGLSIRQRAEALIQIAHPKFRQELYDYCERHRWLPVKPEAAYAMAAK
jgi:acyl-CoA hydrolase